MLAMRIIVQGFLAHLGIFQRCSIDEIGQSRRVLEITRCLALSDRFVLEAKRVELC